MKPWHLVALSMVAYFVVAAGLAWWLDGKGVPVLLIALLNYVVATVLVGPSLYHLCRQADRQ